MTYFVTDQKIGSQAIAETSAVQKHELGTIVRAFSPTYGEGEFIYLVGVASTILGSAVVYRLASGQTALAPVGTNLPERLAFAMSVNVADQYGWYQISGIANAAKATATSLAADIAVGINTIGLVSASSTGDEVLGALVSVATATAILVVPLQVSRPINQGRIT
jgi:hypothetical protein